MSKKLTKNTLTKYKLVIDEWFNNDFNGKRAYLKFYRRVKENTATTNFSKIQQLPEIKTYMAEKYEEAAAIVETTHKGILKELINWVSSDITQTMELTPEEVKGLPIEVRRLITKYKTTERNIYCSKGNVVETIKTVELHFVSKERAIEMINKHVGFYEIDNRQRTTAINITTTNDTHRALVEGIINGS